ncbi:unnamed protein product, partial [marine sediment metagenome]
MAKKYLKIPFILLIFCLVGIGIFYFLNGWKESQASPDPSSTTYEFTDTVNNKAYYGKDLAGAVPVAVTRADWDVPGQEFAPGDYTNVSSADNNYFLIGADTDKFQQLVHDFVFKINQDPDDITSIELYWEGYGAKGAEAEADNDLRMYLYNVNTGLFDLVDDSQLNNNCPGPTDCTMTYTINANFSNYINGSGYLRFLVQKYEEEDDCAGYTCGERGANGCVAKAAQCLDTCQKCDGVSLNPVNIT